MPLVPVLGESQHLEAEAGQSELEASMARKASSRMTTQKKPGLEQKTKQKQNKKQ